MSSEPVKELSILEKETQFYQGQDTIQKLCRHIASGGLLLDFVESHGVLYGDVKRWIDADPTRKELFTQAMSHNQDLKTEKLLRELARAGFSDIRKLYDEKGNLKNVADLDDATAAALNSIEVFEEFEGFGRERHQIGVTKKIKMIDKLKALELYGKTFAAYTEKVQANLNLSLEDIVAASWEPKKEEPKPKDLNEPADRK